MKPETQEQLIARLHREVDALIPRGFTLRDGYWSKDGVLYDFSSADLSNIDLIMTNKSLFVVNDNRGKTDVLLTTAYRWVCDNCDYENFENPNKSEFDIDEREEAYRLFHDLEDWQELPDNWAEFEMVEIPSSVKCKSCGWIFNTKRAI